MLKRLGITQRVEVIDSYGERRDCLDQRWSSVGLALGFVPVPLPNVAPEHASRIVSALSIDALLLSGGNSLAFLDNTATAEAPERDSFEHALVTCAIARSIPVFGVCRGLQFLNVFLGGGLSPCEGHAGVRHTVEADKAVAGFETREVNSYHDWCIPKNQLAEGLVSFAQDSEGRVEAFVHTTEKIAGVMWHPEREPILDLRDTQLLKKYLL